MTAAAPPAVVHLDCDGLADIFRVHGWRRDGAGDPLFDRGLPHALDFFEAEGVRATLFVIASALDDPARRARLREAVARGHEVASHSLTHRPLPALPLAEKRREIEESRARIAQALGVAVRGFRAPAFAIDRESLELVAGAGYAYDSSLHAGAAGALGPVPEGPHRPLAGPLLELPMPRSWPLPFHPSYALVLGLRYFRARLARAARSGAPLVLLFHLTDLADPLDAADLPSLRARFFTLSWLSRERKRSRCVRMLDELRARFGLTDTASLLAAHEAAA
jgi:peptidoglycan/xylan/chitin deacetylase (PgdA/CDA1 family)